MTGIGKLCGLIVGLVFGIIWVIANFADAVLVLVLGIIGYYVGAFLAGEINLAGFLNRG
ncbi:MAG: DUF2273 domain-containing protein [Chloroflexota bacterium]